MKRRDFFRSCVAAAGVCALPSPMAAAGCIAITAIDFYAGTITVSGAAGQGQIKTDQYVFVNRGESAHFEVGMPARFNIEELT